MRRHAGSGTARTTAYSLGIAATCAALALVLLGLDWSFVEALSRGSGEAAAGEAAAAWNAAAEAAAEEAAYSNAWQLAVEGAATAETFLTSDDDSVRTRAWLEPTGAEDRFEAHLAVGFAEGALDAASGVSLAFALDGAFTADPAALEAVRQGDGRGAEGLEPQPVDAGDATWDGDARAAAIAPVERYVSPGVVDDDGFTWAEFAFGVSFAPPSSVGVDAASGESRASGAVPLFAPDSAHVTLAFAESPAGGGALQALADEGWSDVGDAAGADEGASDDDPAAEGLPSGDSAETAADEAFGAPSDEGGLRDADGEAAASDDPEPASRELAVAFPQPCALGLLYALPVLVTDADGYPLAGAHVQAVAADAPDGPPAARAESDEAGHAVLAPLPAGRYAVQVDQAPEGHDPAESSYAVLLRFDPETYGAQGDLAAFPDTLAFACPFSAYAIPPEDDAPAQDPAAASAEDGPLAAAEALSSLAAPDAAGPGVASLLGASDPLVLEEGSFYYERQKLTVTVNDEAGQAVSGAAFLLYFDYDGDGSFSRLSGATVNGEHQDSQNPPVTSVGGSITYEGIVPDYDYLLVPQGAPDGFALNGDAYRIVLDDSGQGDDELTYQVYLYRGSSQAGVELSREDGAISLGITLLPMPPLPVTGGAGMGPVAAAAAVLLAGGAMLAVGAAGRLSGRSPVGAPAAGKPPGGPRGWPRGHPPPGVCAARGHPEPRARGPAPPDVRGPAPPDTG